MAWPSGGKTKRAPVAALFPPQGQWTEEDYFALPDTNRYVELSEGRLIVPPHPTNRHQVAVLELAMRLRQFVMERGLDEVRIAPLPVRLWPGKIREPDTFFIAGEHADHIGERVCGVPDLVVEVTSPSTARTDRMEKFQEYARMEVRSSSRQVTEQLLLSNTLLNVFAQLVPVVVGLVTVPLIVRGLGKERFGLLSLAWAFLGYSVVLEMGLGRAITKFVAEALGRGRQDEIPALLWTAAVAQAVLGVLGALIAGASVPIMVERVLHIPPSLGGEARATFYLLIFSIPVVLLTNTLLGVLEAAQRFDLVNAVRVPSSISVFVMPLVGMAFDLRLPGIMGLIWGTRALVLVASAAILLRIFPVLRKVSVTVSAFRRLLRFGSWVTVTDLIGPLFKYSDRFFIGLFLPVSSVAYYTVSYEIAVRLWVIPTSLTMTLFPAFSALQGVGDRQKTEVLAARSVKYILLTLGVVAVTVAGFADRLLQVWVGHDFAAEGAVVLQVLSCAILINSLAGVPYTLLRATGRPDIPAKFHLAEILPYLALLWTLVRKWGIIGASVAFLVLVTLDAILLFVAVFTVCRISPRLLTSGLPRGGLILLVTASLAWGLRMLGRGLPVVVQTVCAALLLGFCAWLIWIVALDREDRDLIRTAVRDKLKWG